MTPLTSAIIMKALDGLSLRETVAAENIANANTAGYRPRQVNFESALAQAASKGKQAVQSVQPAITSEISGLQSSAVRIDQELATATAAAGRYGALIDLINRQMQIAAMPLER